MAGLTACNLFQRLPRESIDWVENDAGSFTEPDAKLLKELEIKHGVPMELVIKLLEVETAQVGSPKEGV